MNLRQKTVARASLVVSNQALKSLVTGFVQSEPDIFYREFVLSAVKPDKAQKISRFSKVECSEQKE